MKSQEAVRELSHEEFPQPGADFALAGCRRCAVFNVPQNEEADFTHLELREAESFLFPNEIVRLWKNPQRVRTMLALSRSYLFAHAHNRERVEVPRSPGELQIACNCREHAQEAGTESELLCSGFRGLCFGPFRERIVAEQVRIKSGAPRGAQGTLVRKLYGMRLVLTLELKCRHRAIHMDADAWEPAPT